MPKQPWHELGIFSDSLTSLETIPPRECWRIMGKENFFQWKGLQLPVLTRKLPINFISVYIQPCSHSHLHWYFSWLTLMFVCSSCNPGALDRQGDLKKKSENPWLQIISEQQREGSINDKEQPNIWLLHILNPYFPFLYPCYLYFFYNFWESDSLVYKTLRMLIFFRYL